MNKVYLIGNLTADPIKTVSGEVAVCRFSIAVNRRFTGSDGERGVDFFRVVCFRKTAELCEQYLSKGKKVAIAGSLQTGEYTDKEGIRRQSTDIVADEVEFLTPRGESGESNPGNGGGKRTERLEPMSDESLPFF